VGCAAADRGAAGEASRSIPVVAVLGIQVAQILGGTVIIETIFGLPG
jgi:ABC-type dipeptide/oligopeptide/nickel transport system permease component